MPQENPKGWSQRFISRAYRKDELETRSAVRAERERAAAEAAAKQEAVVEKKPAPISEPDAKAMLAQLKAAGVEVPETTAPARVKEIYDANKAKLEPKADSKPKVEPKTEAKPKGEKA